MPLGALAALVACAWWCRWTARGLLRRWSSRTLKALLCESVWRAAACEPAHAQADEAAAAVCAALRRACSTAAPVVEGGPCLVVGSQLHGLFSKLRGSVERSCCQRLASNVQTLVCLFRIGRVCHAGRQLASRATHSCVGLLDLSELVGQGPTRGRAG